jgi:hypothetical protein
LFRMKWVLFTMALAVVAATFVNAQELESQDDRLATLGSYEAEHNARVDFSGETAVPDWLDEILSRKPENGVHEDSEKEFDKPVESVAKDSGTPIDPYFPQPANIPPLYLSPKIEGEGAWTGDDLPKGSDGRPLV